jgi:hypothetical protein
MSGIFLLHIPQCPYEFVIAPSILPFYTSAIFPCIHVHIVRKKLLLSPSSPCPSACPHVPVRPRVPVDGFMWYLILETFTKICRETPDRGKNSRHCTWRPKYISSFPATLNRHKWNGKRLLGWPTRHKHCCVKRAFPVSFHHNLLLHSFSFLPLSHTL